MKQVPDETFRALLDALYKALFWLGKKCRTKPSQEGPCVKRTLTSPNHKDLGQ